MTNYLSIESLSAAQKTQLNSAIEHKIEELLGEQEDQSALQYVLILLTKGKSKQDFAKSIELFFDEASEEFVDWLYGVIEKQSAKKAEPTLNASVNSQVKVKETVVNSKAKAAEAQFNEEKNRQVKLKEIVRTHALLNKNTERKQKAEPKLDSFISLSKEEKKEEPESGNKGKVLFTKRKLAELGEEVAPQALEKKPVLTTKPAKFTNTDDTSSFNFKPTTAKIDAFPPAAGTNIVKCRFFPGCTKGSGCPFFHPTELCKYFPKCTAGDQCLYIHQAQPFKKFPFTPAASNSVVFPPPGASEIPCKFGTQCTRPGCFYQHPKPTEQGSETSILESREAVLKASEEKNAILCKFDPFCSKIVCPFQHPKRDAFAAQ